MLHSVPRSCSEKPGLSSPRGVQSVIKRKESHQCNLGVEYLSPICLRYSWRHDSTEAEADVSNPSAIPLISILCHKPTTLCSAPSKTTYLEDFDGMAVAVIGLASNILQLIECGNKVIMIAKELHGSGQDATQANENATFVAQEMRELSLRIINDLPKSNLTDDEEAMCRLAQQCSQLSNKLLVLLDSLKVGNPKRKRDMVTAVFRNMRKRSERDQLQADLDNHRKQLHVQINAMSRSDLTRRLEHALNTLSMSRQDILYLRDHVQKLQQKSMIDSANMMAFLRQLQEVVEVPLRQLVILQSIRDPRMHDRFENIDPAHRKTFEWLLHGPENLQDDGDQECTEDNGQNQTPDVGEETTYIQAKRRQHKEFVAWLQAANVSLPDEVPSLDTSSNEPRFVSSCRGSIFRITGKPGAGKSTLMKFLCESDTTLDYLKTWSGDKHLICAKAFFWRLGIDEQKNLSGLINCLLYQILKAAPELIPIAFPSAWRSDLMSHFPFEPNGTQAFDILLRSGRVFEKHKAIFFIDGLDEFKGPPLDLVRKIIDWATSNPTDLKICVSSRQWNEFEVGFDGYPSLRIHEWTRDDIKIFVTDRFGEICDLSTSVNKLDLNTLADIVVDKAEGVFLWVRVVLAAIEQGVLNDDDFQDLREKVTAFPSELNDLYQYLFDSIQERDRQRAFEILMLTYYGGTSEPQALLRYKFLSDISKDPDFATKLSMRPLQEEELKRSLTIAGRQINGKCKGFLEISPTKREYHRGDEDVKFMHSTVTEFLSRPNIRKVIDERLININIFDLICQSFVAFAKSIDTDEFYSQPIHENERFPWDDGDEGCPFIVQLNNIIGTCIRGSGPITCRIFTFLGQIEQIIGQRLQKRLDNSQRITLENDIMYRHRPDYCSSTPFIFWILPTQLCKVLAARHLLFEYFDNDGQCDIRTLYQDDPVSMKQIVNSVISGLSEKVYSLRAFRMLEILFRNGQSPTVQIELYHLDGETNSEWYLWDWILRRLIFIGSPIEKLVYRGSDYEKGFGYRLIELCLRYGAGENFTLTFGPCYEVIGADRLVVQVHGGDSNGRRTDIDVRQFRDICVDYHLDIVRYARKKDGVLTLRDLLAYCFPHDFHRLYELLDKHPVSLTTERADESLNSDLSVMPILFPEENRYFDEEPDELKRGYYGDEKKPRHCRQCLVHSEKCFEDFEARLRDKESGSIPDKPRCEPTMNDTV
ncbi:hypothetical protein K449DRAFT_425929 [Hypoxylon sp. EC38]|nr:hypothetical protein K449DRAFT_425929 [Hypoxylon sp. EC38]